jgi:hypothetical protein
VKFRCEFDLENVNSDSHVIIMSIKFSVVHQVSTSFHLAKNFLAVFCWRASRKIIADEKLLHQLLFVIMISRNIRSSLSTLMHDRSASSHIELSNLMCVRCIKRLTTVSDHICVTRVNWKKCRYCANQRHKCVFVDVRLRIVCATLLIIIDVALLLKYDVDVKKRCRSIDDSELH